MNNIQEIMELSDDQIIKQFKIEDHWGLSTGIDLEKCNPEKISNVDIIKEFTISICDYIGIKRNIEPFITKFNDNPKTSGCSFSLIGDIFLISGNFKEFDGRSFIDIFSSKSYKPHATAIFCKKYFNAQKMNIRYVNFRD